MDEEKEKEQPMICDRKEEGWKKVSWESEDKKCKGMNMLDVDQRKVRMEGIKWENM